MSDAEAVSTAPESIQVAITVSHIGRDLRQLARDQAEVEALYADERASLDAWRADRLAGMAERREELERQLENACRAGHDLDGRKTWQTPHVRASLRQPSPSTEVVDKAALERWLVAWAVKHGRSDFLHVTALASALEEAGAVRGTEQPGTSTRRAWSVWCEGEAVPGAQLAQSREDTFSYRITPSAGS